MLHKMWVKNIWTSFKTGSLRIIFLIILTALGVIFTDNSMDKFVMPLFAKLVAPNSTEAVEAGVGRRGILAGKSENNFLEIKYNDLGLNNNGMHRIMVITNGVQKEYGIREEIWNDYQDIGGVHSVLGPPLSDEYDWGGGKRQDFQRGNWIYWSPETGVKLNYTPPGAFDLKASGKLQAPLFKEGKPALLWSGYENGAYFISQDFGSNGHYGQDFAVSGDPNPGYEVRPITEGRVVFAGWAGNNSWGFSVLIQHKLNDGKIYYSQYSHLYDLPAVKVGDEVKKDTVLGLVGNTGRSFGPHLDLQIKEIPHLSGASGEEAKVEDLGYGYSENNRSFSGDSILDPRNGQIYYRPSSFVINYNSQLKNN